MFSVHKVGYRNLSFAMVAVSDEQHLSEEIASALLEYEQVWNLIEARIANSTGRSINSTYMCSRPSESEGEHNPSIFDSLEYLQSDTAVDMNSAISKCSLQGPEMCLLSMRNGTCPATIVCKALEPNKLDR